MRWINGPSNGLGSTAKLRYFRQAAIGSVSEVIPDYVRNFPALFTAGRVMEVIPLTWGGPGRVGSDRPDPTRPNPARPVNSPDTILSPIILSPPIRDQMVALPIATARCLVENISGVRTNLTIDGAADCTWVDGQIGRETVVPAKKRLVSRSYVNEMTQFCPETRL